MAGKASLGESGIGLLGLCRSSCGKAGMVGYGMLGLCMAGYGVVGYCVAGMVRYGSLWQVAPM